MSGYKPVDCYGQSTLKRKPIAFPLIGGHAHGQLYELKDEGCRTLVICQPPEVSTHWIEPNEAVMAVKQDTYCYTELYHPFYGYIKFFACQGIPDAELRAKIFEYFNIRGLRV